MIELAHLDVAFGRLLRIWAGRLSRARRAQITIGFVEVPLFGQFLLAGILVRLLHNGG